MATSNSNSNSESLTPSEKTSVCQEKAWPSSCSGLAKWYNMDQMRLQQ